ncbi:hypothetical protein AGMMS50230_16670 [Spirochaetia bacterium]|nr:hypothetical protein AGMMS50230_16670 [Spirochaetia bacterium]
MTRETFSAVMTKILPFSRKEGILVSCLYEPTLHPDFIDMYSSLPLQYKDNFFFTTNLVRHLTDTEINKMAYFNVHHINISLETFDEKKYTEITGVKNTCFYDNLSRVFKIFKDASPPRVRFITMLIRNNYSEILSLAQKAHDMYPLDMHEFRTPYLHNETDLEKILLTENELNDLVPKIRSLGYSNIYISADSNLEQFIKVKAGWIKSNVDEVKKVKLRMHEDYQMRINANGKGFFNCDGSEFDINIINTEELRSKLLGILRYKIKQGRYVDAHI